jgi:hypothetical protein
MALSDDETFDAAMSSAATVGTMILRTERASRKLKTVKM